MLHRKHTKVTDWAMPGNPSLKGANSKRVWEQGLTQGARVRHWENSLPFTVTKGTFCCWSPNEALDSPSLGTHWCCLFSSLSPPPALQSFPKDPTPHCWVRLKRSGFQLSYEKGLGLGWGLFGGFFVFFSPKVHSLAKQASLLIGFLFSFKLLIEFFSPALLGLQFHARNLVAIPVLEISFWVPLPCNVWSPPCAAAVVHDISLAGELTDPL